ncbi:MAG: FecR family protein, partial [Deltaproteobacteria bacterium]|nr:FecR family protein [Deltaproteobacteria bacterium]
MIGLAGGAVIVREGAEIPIEVGMEIRLSDTVRTGSAGRVRILFNDDSLVAVGPGALFRMDEYSDSGSDQSFKANVTEGLARFVTGKIVEANPKGFQVTAPEAVVGIRGTIITVRAERERT